jgi:hypothetical protein
MSCCDLLALFDIYQGSDCQARYHAQVLDSDPTNPHTRCVTGGSVFSARWSALTGRPRLRSGSLFVLGRLLLVGFDPYMITCVGKTRRVSVDLGREHEKWRPQKITSDTQRDAFKKHAQLLTLSIGHC